MSDLIRRDEAIMAVCLSTTRDSATDTIKELPTAEPKGYVKDGTLTVQMPTIKEAKAVDKIVVYADTYKQEYYMPKVGKWEQKPYKRQGHEEVVIEGYSWRCSNCGDARKRNEPDMNYCPNCGAKMEGSE